jgi:hypothetical protein
LEPQVHAEIENQGNENDSSNAENRWQTVDIDELDFVAAVYDGKWYLGKVITIDDEDDEAILKSLPITEFGFNCDTFCFWYIKHSFTSSIWQQFRYPFKYVRQRNPKFNGSGILLSMSDKETQSSSGGFDHL